VLKISTRCLKKSLTDSDKLSGRMSGVGSGLRNKRLDFRRHLSSVETFSRFSVIHQRTLRDHAYGGECIARCACLRPAAFAGTHCTP